MYGALRVQGKSNKELAQQRIVLVGAGSAGTGVARMLALGMVKQVWRPLLSILSDLCLTPSGLRLWLRHV